MLATTKVTGLRLQPEHHWLTWLCRRAEERSDRSWIEALNEARCRSRLLDLAARHRVLGLALDTLDGSGAMNRLEAPVAQELRKLLQHFRRQTALLEIRRDQALAALAQAAVPCLVLKGAALSATVYRDAVQRHMEDLDLLVELRLWRRAVRALKAGGYAGPQSCAELRAYRSRHFHLPLEHPAFHCVEIHWALQRPGSVFRLDAQQVISEPIRRERPGAPVLCHPRPEYMLLHIVLQNIQESFTRLSRLVDVDRLIVATPELDWHLVSEQALRGNLGPATMLSLQMSHNLLGTPLREDLARQFLPSPIVRFHLSLLEPTRLLLTQRFSASYSGMHLLEAWLCPDARTRLRLLSRRPAAGNPQIVQKNSPWGQRLFQLGKLGLLQLLVLVVAATRMASRSGRSRLRFWSVHGPRQP